MACTIKADVDDNYFTSNEVSENMFRDQNTHKYLHVSSLCSGVVQLEPIGRRKTTSD